MAGEEYPVRDIEFPHHPLEAGALRAVTDNDQCRPRIFELMVVAEREPTLYAAFHHIRVDAQEDSVTILADRLGVDPRLDIRPAVTVAAGAGALLAAQAAWVRGGRPDALPELVVQAFDALTADLLTQQRAGAAPHSGAGAAPHSTTEGKAAS